MLKRRRRQGCGYNSDCRRRNLAGRREGPAPRARARTAPGIHGSARNFNDIFLGRAEPVPHSGSYHLALELAGLDLLEALAGFPASRGQPTSLSPILPADTQTWPTKSGRPGRRDHLAGPGDDRASRRAARPGRGLQRRDHPRCEGVTERGRPFLLCA